MTDTETVTQTEAETRRATLRVRLLPSDPVPADADRVVTLLAPDAGDAPGWGFTAGALGRSHGLIERVGAALEAGEIGRIIAPDPDGWGDDARAAAFAIAAAASVHGVEVAFGEGPARPALDAWRALRDDARARDDGPEGLRTATAVISAWNKRDDVRANLLGLRAQTRPFDDVVVVDNHSSDGTPEMVRRDFPEVRLVVMPNSDYGACETFNVGFASALTDTVAILDDDVVLTPWWLERTLARMRSEPATTAVVSTKVVEPGMPEEYRDSAAYNEERYSSTFRGCASLARKHALDEAGGYDERLFIYGNERDLTCRFLNLGYRVLQFPGAETWHRTPFGVQMGKRSLFYHARNAWIGMLKYAPLKDLLRMPFLVVTKVLLRGSDKEESGDVSVAVGTIGIGKSIKSTKGAWWVLTKAAFSVLYNVPYCLKRREPVRAPDFELPLE